MNIIEIARDPNATDEFCWFASLPDPDMSHVLIEVADHDGITALDIVAEYAGLVPDEYHVFLGGETDPDVVTPEERARFIGDQFIAAGQAEEWTQIDIPWSSGHRVKCRCV